MKFKTKVILLPIIAGVSFILLITLNLVLGRHKTNLDAIKNGYMPAFIIDRDLDEIHSKIQQIIQDAINAGDKDFLENTDELFNQFNEKLKILGENPTQEAGVLATLKSKFQDYHDLARDVSTRMISGEQSDDLLSKQKSMLMQQEEINDFLAGRKSLLKEQMDSAFLDAGSAIKRASATNIIVSICFIIILGFLAAFVIKTTIPIIDDMVNVAIKAGDSDLRQEVQIASSDEIGVLGKSFNKMIGNLRNIITHLRSMASKSASAATQISAATNQIMAGAEVQASAASETKSSMEEMAKQITSIAKNTDTLSGYVDITTSSIQGLGAETENVSKNVNETAANISETSSTIEEMIANMGRISGSINQINRFSQEAAKEATVGGEVLIKTIEGTKDILELINQIANVVDDLSRRSSDVGKITDVIRTIADQTNLLALNAAIEAARAGESGRGFSVVAGEVRKLAEQSLQAADEISMVIKSVQKITGDAVKIANMGIVNAKQGVILTDQAKQIISNIIDTSKRNSEVILQVSSAANEQSTSAKYIIDKVAKMNNFMSSVIQSTNVQVAGVKKIIGLAKNMSEMTTQVRNSTSEQKQASTHVLETTQDISKIAGSTLVALKDLSKSSADMAQQSVELQKFAEQFKTN